MSHHRVVAMLLCAPLLAACAAGRNAQTALVETVSDAANANVGQLQVRNVRLAAPETSLYGTGADVPLYLTVANRAGSADSLTDVTSDDAASVRLMPADAASGTATPAADSGAGQPTPASTMELPLSVPTGAALILGADSVHLVLQGIRRPLRPGQSVRVTFTFADAGSTTLSVPVQLPEDGSAAQ